MSRGRRPGPAGVGAATPPAAAQPSRTGGAAVLNAPLGLVAEELKKRVAHHGPQLKLTGAEAMKVAGNILLQSHPLIFPSALGPVKLVPGTVWAGRRMLIYAAPLYCYFTIDDRLYEWQTHRFVQDEWFHALATGASRAAHWESIGKAQAALICGIFFPWYVMLGIACAQMTILYFSHKALIHDVMDKAPLVIEKLSQVRSKNPELFKRLMLQAARELLVNLPSGVSIEDVAFFVGRVIRGSAAAAPALSIKVLAKIVATTAPLVAATHLPSMTGHVLDAEVKKRAAEYQRKLAEAGYTVTLEEAEIILKDALSKGDSQQTLEELKRALEALTPSLEQLSNAL
jgi:hypothetical protein